VVVVQGRVGEGATMVQALPYEVLATKKGAFPVTVEKRPKGKVVTVVRARRVGF
jgi:hypothetical protein